MAKKIIYAFLLSILIFLGVGLILSLIPAQVSEILLIVMSINFTVILSLLIILEKLENIRK